MYARVREAGQPLDGQIWMNLQRDFQQVRATFFPRWDRSASWKCRAFRDLHGAGGECNTDSKTVRSAVTVGDPTLVLIHEICHAVGGNGHGKKWQSRMEKAATRAQDVGRPELAMQIRKEIREYQETPLTTDADIYNQIDDVLSAAPETSMTQVADEIRRTFGVSMSRKAFLFKYRRFKNEFAEKQRYWNR
jgi:hypothetical protein